MPEIPSVTLPSLGAMVRYYRELRGWSQSDLCSAIGWEDQSRLSRLESGKGPRPERGLVERIMISLGLERDERGALLLAGGYLPDEGEIRKMLETTGLTLLREWEYPAYLMDFTWRVIEGNDAIVALFGIRPDQREFLRTARPNLLELVFDPEYGIHQQLELNGWEQYAREEVAHFKTEHRLRTAEPWYRDLIQRLSRLEDFRQAWAMATPADDVRLVTGYIKFSVQPKPGDVGSQMDFHSFGATLTEDPRFFLDRYVPANQQTFGRFSSLIRRARRSTQRKTVSRATERGSKRTKKRTK